MWWVLEAQKMVGEPERDIGYPVHAVHEKPL